jgi:hypothetical protein
MKEEEFVYDEEAMVAFILNSLPEELKLRFDDDTIYYIADVICDFYDSNDWLNCDDEEKEERELVKYIISQAAKDGIGEFTEDEIRIVLAAESAYNDTLNIE